MNIFNKFPTSILIDGSEYEIDTDFRPAILTLMAFEDEYVDKATQVLILLANLYKGVELVFENEVHEEAVKLALDFLNCDYPSNNFGTKDTQKSSGRTFSFAKDGQRIYAAFRSSYGINLNETEHLHWYDFYLMLSELDENTQHMKIVSLRHKKNEGKLTKEEAEVWNKLSDVLEFEPPRKEKELEERALKGLGKFKGTINGIQQ